MLAIGCRQPGRLPAAVRGAAVAGQGRLQGQGSMGTGPGLRRPAGSAARWPRCTASGSAAAGPDDRRRCGSRWPAARCRSACSAPRRCLWLAIVFSATMWAGVTYGNILWFTVLQERVPAGLLGRMMSLDLLLSVAMGPLGFFLGGLGSHWFGAAGHPDRRRPDRHAGLRRGGLRAPGAGAGRGAGPGRRTGRVRGRRPAGLDAVQPATAQLSGCRPGSPGPACPRCCGAARPRSAPGPAASAAAAAAPATA